MSAGEHTTVAANTNTTPDDQSLKLALAISLLRSKFIQNRPPPTDRNESDALRWKRKAKERKQELLRLREDLKEAEDASQCDLFPKSASCKCYFFDNLGKLSPQGLEDGSDRRFNDVLRRRFLRHVRFKERRRGAGASIQRRQFSVLNTEDEETEQLRASVDFLVELCDTVSPVGEANFANWAHQAVDFILASLKNLLPRGKDTKLIEGIVNSLIMRLVRRMCSPSKVFESLHTGLDAQFYVQHLIRKLGSEAYVGQRAILSVSQRISVLAESFLFLDPFDDSFPGMHGCMFTLIQLIEFLISDYLLIWSCAEGFDKMLFEEWVASILHSRKALELLESRNGLYVLYMDRVTGELAKQVGQSSSLQKLKPEILDNLFH
ncbi:protein MULTIPOLAR SPINDLE 1 isoform X2 [Juglans microcarpa x Juglans regia]|uniref:protein MULTIPOLAR SPINDLE 1 isoform X2 n=1 Tax=Juglans microcarpa x Juglans regia TaxID=2249226 RepID=UPI001B7F38E6|nr:protein MULTIPOLAR SPINDLE 1 isoform X2 [Juglans microcarpa x Juglans regia]